MAEKNEGTPTPTLMDAINSSLESLKPAESKAPVTTEEETDEETGSTAGESEETPAGEESTEGEGGEETGEEKPGKKDGEKEETAEEKAAREAAETPEQKAAREAEEAKNKKPPNHIDDPIPPGVSQRTRERITALVKEVKDRDSIVEQHRELFQTIQSTGVSAENFAQTLTVLRLFNSDDLNDKRQAYTFLQKQVAFLAKEIGEAVPGVDPLADHKDLQDLVAAQAITQEAATELATHRNRVKAAEAATTRTVQTAEQQAAEYNHARAAATEGLNTLGATLSAIDPNYATKAAAVVAKLKTEFASLHPSKWVKRFQEEYAAHKAPKAPAAGAGAQGAPRQSGQPLRPNKQPAGGGSQKAPTSALEAMEAGLAALKS